MCFDSDLQGISPDGLTQFKVFHWAGVLLVMDYP